MLAWDCRGSLGGCHPHGHHVTTTLHSTFGPLGALLLLIAAAYVWDQVFNK